MTDLQHSHAELRAALILAGKRIVKLSFGRRDMILSCAFCGEFFTPLSIVKLIGEII